MIHRSIQEQFDAWMGKGKIIVLYGPRQVGKTTFLQQYFSNTSFRVNVLNGDRLQDQELMKIADGASIQTITDGVDVLVIDEAQKIDNIGTHLKVLYDSGRSGQIIATGSSSFDLANRVSEPLTGRYVDIRLYPLSLQELVQHENRLSVQRNLDKILTYGLYPEIYQSPPAQASLLLQHLTGSYLYQDVLAFDKIKKSHTLVRLLRLLAMQVGSQVSYHELGQQLGLHTQTIEKYIDLLEKSFVLFRLPSYATNPRKELSKSKKIYFRDIGVRNTLVGSTQDIHTRVDQGAIWENFVIAEKMKQMHYTHRFDQSYFRRSKNQQEVDYVEYDGIDVHAYEIKWNTKKKHRVTAGFTHIYPDAMCDIITPENMLDLLVE